MKKPRPFVLSIAGYDPSGGAGLLADVKTFEANKAYGFGVCSALTIQNDTEVISCEWKSADYIILQIETLLKKFKVDWVKIGIVKDAETLIAVTGYLKNKNTKTRIIWDPILKSSSGFDFHSQIESEKLKRILADIFLITPNLEEIKKLFPGKNEEDAALELSSFCKVFLKGGHSEINPGKDYLFTESKKFAFNSKATRASQKHGSGCVLSSALTANLANGYPLNKACLRAKDYVTYVLESNGGLLGYHKL